MDRNIYIFSSGIIERKDNTLYFKSYEGNIKAIPVETVENIYLMGEVELNTKLLDFLSQHKIVLHNFNYYGYYTGSFYPREYLNSGFLLVKQVEHYKDKKLRLKIAKEMVSSAIHNIKYNLKHYEKNNKDVDDAINFIEEEENKIETVKEIPELMSIEGHIREKYYQTFNEVLNF
ncbi:MAG: CRISPR-associated endonuclease Cas1, partial [Elusimicrobiota bacterium]|nr:CRISPR-associated endonuclease Cas1 [Endomicrobiia bacterium]MDW8166266.1 CRISPR-associated endonuclease Cas1 [Elusimicrobiota bacterium]